MAGINGLSKNTTESQKREGQPTVTRSEFELKAELKRIEGMIKNTLNY